MRSLRLAALAAMLLTTPAAAQVYNQIPTTQTSVGTTATLVAAARPGRTRITIGIGAANACAVGGPGITLTTGFALAATAGATIVILTNNDVYAVCAATTTVSTLEETR
jgi:glycerate kinase